MTTKKQSNASELRGSSQLAVEATKAITSIVEEMHRTIASGPAILGRPLEAPARLATRIVYGPVREITSVVGAGIDWALDQLSPVLGESIPGLEREALRAVLNGVIGDYLADTNNPLAIPMRLRHETSGGDASAAAVPSPKTRLLIMVHGTCMNDRQWRYAGHDHGAALARELDFELVHLLYNSGKHVSTNGREFAALLEDFVAQWPNPVEEIVIFGYSMGGLLARSACHIAEQDGLEWRKKLRTLLFVGTPHHGALLERAGNWLEVLLGINRYSAPLARLAKLRSAGITDLRHGNVLDEHWQGRDRFELESDTRTPLPLPEGVACYAIAGTRTTEAEATMRGDGLVSVDSAYGQHKNSQQSLAIPDAHKYTSLATPHLELLGRSDVYEVLLRWLS